MTSPLIHHLLGSASCQADPETLCLNQLKELATKEYNSPTFYESPFLNTLPLPHRLQLAEYIGQHTQSNALFQNIDAFRFDQPTIEKLLYSLAEKNPALLFDNWQTLSPTLTPTLAQQLMSQLPFLEIQNHLIDLWGKEAWPDMKDDLSLLLQSLHTLNKQIAIPSLFYSSCSPLSFRSLIAQRAFTIFSFRDS